MAKRTRMAKGLSMRPLSSGLALPMKEGKVAMKMPSMHGTGVGVKTKRYKARPVGRHKS